MLSASRVTKYDRRHLSIANSQKAAQRCRADLINGQCSRVLQALVPWITQTTPAITSVFVATDIYFIVAAAADELMGNFCGLRNVSYILCFEQIVLSNLNSGLGKNFFCVSTAAATDRGCGRRSLRALKPSAKPRKTRETASGMASCIGRRAGCRVRKTADDCHAAHRDMKIAEDGTIQAGPPQ
jgi:hypothetical protein